MLSQPNQKLKNCTIIHQKVEEVFGGKQQLTIVIIH